MTAEATAGGGMVKAVAQGDVTILSVTIDPDAVDPEDAEMLQDMVVAACNEALRAVSAQGSARISAATGGMNIPGFDAGRDRLWNRLPPYKSCSTSLSACRA